MRCAGRSSWPTSNPDWVFLYQYANEANPKAHYRTTGPEIWADVPDITHFVAGLGTSGTLLGVGTYPQGAEPRRQDPGGRTTVGRAVEGLRSLEDGYIPPVFDKWGGYDLLDGKSIVRPRESLEFTRALADVGIFSGISAGAALAGAVKVASRIDVRHDRVRRVRLRLEVPVDRRLDARPGRGDGERREGHLLLSASPLVASARACVTVPSGCSTPGSVA